MPATARSVPPRASPARSPASRPARRPLRDNPRLLLLGIGVLLAALAGMIALADRSSQLSPDFLSEAVLYALTAADLTMLVALAFVLARNVIKLVVERRRALPFARFRAKLVAALLGMTIVPAVLVLIVGSELIRNSADRWFSAPIDDVLTSASRIASEFYHEREVAAAAHAGRIARALPPAAIAAGDLRAVQAAVAREVTERGVGLVEVYRILPRPGNRPDVVPVVDVAAPGLPRGYVRASADRLAARVAAGDDDWRPLPEPLPEGGQLVRAAALVREGGPRGAAVGVVVASEYLSSEVTSHARRITEAYEGYRQLQVLRRPLAGVYLSFFLMVTLMILVSATWMGLYIAKRITRPVQMLAAGAREIGAGRLDHRIEQETADEFGSLVEAFNTMAGELAASQRKLERSRIDLERTTLEIDERRRYIETILERIATGVVSIDPRGRISTVNSAAARLLGLDESVSGRPAAAVFGREDLRPIGALLRGTRSGAPPGFAQEIALARDGREIHLAAAATILQGGAGSFEGTVLVFDDVTPLIRAQRVATWRDVARRLAHEIKNPLTPIQLCAERMRRHFGSAPAPAAAVVEECTATIITEVESLKALVDEFAQFARMPAPKTVPTDLERLLSDALALYNNVLGRVRLEARFARELPLVRVDPEQIRRVVINLVDNALEALGGPEAAPRPDGEPGHIVLEAQHEPAQGLARIVVADNGPGIPAADRDKLFMPYYSTKRRGSGLGLAIVRRIIAEHGGNIEVSDNAPAGTRFTIELPC